MSEYVKYSEYEKEMQIARDLAIKDATQQELLQNDAVRELVESLCKICCSINYKTSRNIALKALKKFEAIDE